MNTQSFSILFWISKNRIKNGKAPLSVRITVNGRRVELSAQRDVTVINWDSKAQVLFGKSEEAKEINNHIAGIKIKLLNCCRKLEIRDELITAENIKNEYTGVVEKPRMLLPIFRQHNDDILTLVGNGYAKGTWVKFNTVLKHIEAFLQWKHKATDIDIKNLNIEFFGDLEFFLRSQKKIDINTTTKYLKSLKKVVTECVCKSWLVRHPFMGYKFKTKNVEREFLSEQELAIIQEKHFVADRLNLVRDIFVFSCYTGLAYIDVASLTPKHVSFGIDGEKWIFTQRQKTKTASHIPILPPAMAIIEKYSNHPQVVNKEKLLPVLTNQKMNAYLKEIADCCSIAKELTFHIARHTFATTVTLSNDVPIETVSKMLGHTNLRTTQHYAKIIDRKVSNDMKQLRSIYSNEKKEDSQTAACL